MNKIILHEHDGYSLTVEVSRCPIPSDLYQIKFKKHYELDSRMDSYEQLFLTKESIDLLIKGLDVSDMYKPKCDTCGFINNMEKEPPVIICQSCGNMLGK